jgi:plasmid stabilization system protein ParE
MAEIRWTEEAFRWLKEIFDHIAADDPDVAVRVVNGIYEKIQLISTTIFTSNRGFQNSQTAQGAG